MIFRVPGHSVFDQDIETALADGLDISYYEAGYSGVFEAIDGVGVVPQKIIFDCELPSTWAYFNLMADLNNDQRVALMQSWYDNAGIYARMTPAMKALNAESFRAQTAHLQEWSEWFTEVTVLGGSAIYPRYRPNDFRSAESGRDQLRRFVPAIIHSTRQKRVSDRSSEPDVRMVSADTVP
jgi:hypothetical protein